MGWVSYPRSDEERSEVRFWEFPILGGTLFGVLIIWILPLGCYIRVPYFRKLPYNIVAVALGIDVNAVTPFGKRIEHISPCSRV